MTVSNLLTPDGYFIINEYVGDCYNIYNERQLDIINKILSVIPDEMRSNTIQRYKKNATIRENLAVDPSESVRSKLIMPFLKDFFIIEEEKSMGGCILHSIYPFLDNKKFSGDQPEYSTILKLLLEFELILMENSVLDTDFNFCICRSKQME